MSYNHLYKHWYEKLPDIYYTHPIPTDFSQIWGFCNFSDIYFHMNKHLPKNAVAVEIGTLAGLSSAVMATFIKEARTDISFYSIDPLPDKLGNDSLDYYGQNFDVTMYELFLRNLKSLDLLKYITHLRMKSVPAAKLFDNKSVDFIFIDGDHTTEGVTQDIQAWLPKMKENSVISGHDYDHSTVKVAVDELFKDNKIIIRNTSWIVELGKPTFGFTTTSGIKSTDLGMYSL